MEIQILQSLSLNKAITYRFKKDKKGWRLFASTNFLAPKIITNKNFGAIGIDINERWKEIYLQVSNDNGLTPQNFFVNDSRVIIDKEIKDEQTDEELLSKTGQQESAPVEDPDEKEWLEQMMIHQPSTKILI